MNLYKISQNENNGYDTYDSVIVAAEDEEAASKILPYEYEAWGRDYSAWCSDPSKVKVELIGIAKNNILSGVILASFNAG